MDELLKSILGAEVLTEQSQQQLLEAFQQHLDEQVALAKEDAKQSVTAQLTEQWIIEREALIETIDQKLDEQLEKEFAELRSDIENFRDLEAEYAGKLVEAKASMAEELKSDMAVLLKRIDEFLEDRLTSEFEELREDIEEAKRDRFGRKIMEAFAQEYQHLFVDENATQAKLQESIDQINELKDQAAQLQKANEKLIRESSINSLLSPLSGRQREVMEAILEKTATTKLSETYDKFIGRILTEATNPTSVKESTVLTEGKQTQDKTITEKKIVLKEGNSGNNSAERLNESSLSEDQKIKLRKLSGIE